MYVRKKNVSKLQRPLANWFPASRGLRRQGQCKPNAIELARIAEVQPVLADFIGKIRHNILKEDGFENADPEISRVFPSFPELSREGQKKAPELLRSDASSFVISCLSHIAIPECLYRITLSIWHTQSYQFFIDFLGINWQQDFLCVSQLF